MRKISYLLFSLTLVIACNQSPLKQEAAPWLGLDWMNRVETPVLIKNNTTDLVEITFSHFNKTTREELDYSFSVPQATEKSTSFSLYRPEIFNVKYQDKSFDLFLLPNKQIEISLGDGLQFTGENANIYQQLYAIGDHQIDEVTFKKILSNDSPKWLQDFLVRSRILKELYTQYQKVGKAHFTGDMSARVTETTAKQAEEMIQNLAEGQYHNYYSLLYSFKSFVETEQLADFKFDSNTKYQKRAKLFDKVAQIENPSIRNSLMAGYLEGIIRKRKAFPDKEFLIQNITKLLPEEQVERLNKIEKHYSKRSFDEEAVIALLGKPLPMATGTKAPLSQTNNNYKLIKFWFAGCAPCKKEIPSENALLEKHSQLDVLHFCYSTDKKRWLKYIDDNKTQGHHFLLNQADYELFTLTYGLGYAPRYVLLSPENKVLCWECAKPSSGKIEAMLK